MEKNKYNCQMALDHLVAELQNDDLHTDLLEELIATYPDCQKELQNHYNTWQELKKTDIPTPSADMHLKFYKSLSEWATPHASSQPIIKRPAKRLQLGNWVKYAAAVVLLAAGFFVGQQINNPKLETMAEYDNRQQTDQNIQAIYASSASERLQGVQNTKELTSPDEKIFEALNQTLLHDPNINVRLSAIEAMLYFGDHPLIREYLIKAIPHQDSPIVQVALADAMIALKENRSIESIKELIKNSPLELDVRQHLENTVKVLM